MSRAGTAGGFPKSVCTSINEVMCHGIPDSRPLQEGDIVNIDVTVFLNVRPWSFYPDHDPTGQCSLVLLQALLIG